MDLAASRRAVAESQVCWHLAMVDDVSIASLVVPGPRLLRPRDGFDEMPVSHHGTRSMKGHCVVVMAPSPQRLASAYEARMVGGTDFLSMAGTRT